MQPYLCMYDINTHTLNLYNTMRDTVLNMLQQCKRYYIIDTFPTQYKTHYRNTTPTSIYITWYHYKHDTVAMRCSDNTICV